MWIPIPASQMRKQAQDWKQLVQEPVGPALSDSASRCPTWAGGAWGLRPALLRPGTWGVSLLFPSSAPLTRPARVSVKDEACPCPLSGELGSAGAAGYWSCQGPAHLIKSRSGVGSFYRPHKALLVASSACSWPWHPVPSRAREDEFLLRGADLPDS